jgi:hypothetical protein
MEFWKLDVARSDKRQIPEMVEVAKCFCKICFVL